MWESVEIYEAVNIIIGYTASGNTVFQNVISYKEQCFLDLHPKTLSKYRHIPLDMKIMFAVGSLLTYLLTPWSRVLLEKLTSKLCS